MKELKDRKYILYLVCLCLAIILFYVCSWLKGWLSEPSEPAPEPTFIEAPLEPASEQPGEI